MGVFADQLKAFAEKTKLKTDLTIKEVILGVGATVVGYTPVGQPQLWESKPPKGYVPGRLKANWVGADGGIDNSTTEETDPTGEVSMVAISSAIPEELSGKFYISNSLAYAQTVEDGSAIHNTPPGGMVSLTVLEFSQIVDAAIAKVSAL